MCMIEAVARGSSAVRICNAPSNSAYSPNMGGIAELTVYSIGRDHQPCWAAPEKGVRLSYVDHVGEGRAGIEIDEFEGDLRPYSFILHPRILISSSHHPFVVAAGGFQVEEVSPVLSFLGDVERRVAADQQC